MTEFVRTGEYVGEHTLYFQCSDLRSILSIEACSVNREKANSSTYRERALNDSIYPICMDKCRKCTSWGTRIEEAIPKQQLIERILQEDDELGFDSLLKHKGE